MAQKKYYKLNHRIKESEVRVIDSSGENLGEMKTSDALRLANEEDLDLVIIAEKTTPPVAKILDFNKYLYEENKKLATSKAKSKKSETKEFRLGAKVDDSAIKIKTDRARTLIEGGDRIKVTVRLRGREKARPELGLEKVQKFVDALEDIAKAEAAIKKLGHMYTVTLVKK